MKMNYSLTRESLRGHKMDSTILDEFYQERKNRSMSVKQHNLLKKNISFFNLGQSSDGLAEENRGTQQKNNQFEYSSKNVADDQVPSKWSNLARIDVPRVNIKTYLQNRQWNDKENEVITRNDSTSKPTVKERAQRVKQSGHFDKGRIQEEKQRVKPNKQIQPYQQSRQTGNELNGLQKTWQRPVTFSFQTHQHNEQQQRQPTEPNSPTFPKIASITQLCTNIVLKDEHEDIVSIPRSQYDALLESKKVHDSNTNQIKALQQKLTALQSRYEQIKHKKWQQQKLIMSLHKMRKTLVGTDSQCTLKQLWRWIKQLPRSQLDS